MPVDLTFKSPNYRVAYELLKELLEPCAPQEPDTRRLGARRAEIETEAWQEERDNWESRVEQLLWHIIEAASEEGRRAVRS